MTDCIGCDSSVLVQAQHEVECMKANLEGQQEVTTQVAHMLHSPVAALDYQVRLLNAEEPFVALFRENAKAIAGCMNLIMKISSQFTQHREVSAKMSLDNKQQHSKVAKKTGKPANEPRPRQHDGNLIVMLVDDVECLRGAQQLHLRKLSTQWDGEFVFREAVTGEKCILEVSSRQRVPPHVIVMDQYMHDAGGNLLGSETVHKLRQNGFQGLIIGCSGNAECKQLFMDAGADYFW